MRKSEENGGLVSDPIFFFFFFFANMSWLIVTMAKNIYAVLSYYLNNFVQFASLALTALSELHHCDLDYWRMDLKIHKVFGRGTAHIQVKPTKFVVK